MATARTRIALYFSGLRSSSLWSRLRRRPRQSRENPQPGLPVQVVAGTPRLLLRFARLPTVKLLVVRLCTSEPRLLSAAPSLRGGGSPASSGRRGKAGFGPQEQGPD